MRGLGFCRVGIVSLSGINVVLNCMGHHGGLEIGGGFVVGFDVGEVLAGRDYRPELCGVRDDEVREVWYQ